MPRRMRLDLPGVPLHVVQRGNNRQGTFFADADRLFYLQCLREAAEQHSCDIHAYVLITNHVHLLVTPYVSRAVSRLMQSVGRRYVQYVNYTYRRTGTLWEGRFKASLVEDEPYLLRCYRYIELNPVRAKMVDRPDQYRWSSFAYHALGESNPLIRDHPLYIALGRTADERRHAYQTLFRHQVDLPELKEIREALNYELVLGTEGFRQKLEGALGRRVHVPVRGRPRKFVARERLTRYRFRPALQK